MHFYIEHKNENNEWEYTYLSDKDGDPITYYYRNYLLFGLLAEVRAMGVPGFTKSYCQLPGDISKEVAKEWDEWEKSAHSTVWYSLSELNMFLKYLELQAEFEEFKCNVKNDDDENYWLEEGYAETKESIDTLSKFINFIQMVLYYNNIFGDDARVILWFDN